MLKKILTLTTLYLFTLPLILQAEDSVIFKFGLVADCQYCDKPDRGKRMYKSSIERLKAFVEEENKHDLKFTAHLGDFIDAKEASFPPLLKVLSQAKAPIKHVLGNHDFSVSDSVKKDVPNILGMPSKYYSFVHFDWKFIVIDGNDISYNAYPKKSAAYKLADKYYKEKGLKKPRYNGALSEKQLKWLEDELKASQQKGEKVILFSHFPIYPDNYHNSWNDLEVIALLEKYSCVKAYMNGHNHKGNYAQKEGIHYFTQKGMVENKEPTFTIVSVTNSKLLVKGFGAEKDRELKITTKQ